VRSFLASSLAALFRSERGDALFQGTAAALSSAMASRWCGGAASRCGSDGSERTLLIP
jgi:hypothetical protein